MKRILTFALLLLLCSATWRTDFEQAKTEAAQQHKYVLLKFSGSDWCLPCIRMEKKVFSDENFEAYAQEHLVLVNADFPQQKKNKPSKEIIQQNEALAEQYNKEGKFPYTILLDAEGKVLKEWNGYKDETPESFMADINAVVK